MALTNFAYMVLNDGHFLDRELLIQSTSSASVSLLLLSRIRDTAYPLSILLKSRFCDFVNYMLSGYMVCTTGNERFAECPKHSAKP
jgi:hypothetical protein